MSQIQGTELAQMATLEKVWDFEDQVFSGVQKSEEAQKKEDQEASVEEKEENLKIF